MEPRIHEFAPRLRLRKIPTASFEANALYLELIRLAYNLVTIFQRMCLPEEWQSLTLSKLLRRLFWLPGELTRPHNRPTLRLAKSRIIVTWSEQVLHRTHKFKTTGELRLRTTHL